MTKIIERILVTVVAIAMMFASTTNVEAAARENIAKAKFEKFINGAFDDAYEDWKTAKEEGDEKMSLIGDMSMTYNEVGINVYHIQLNVELENGDHVEGHVFYDAVEEEFFAEYYQIEGERFSSEEFEELYPDYPLL